MNLAPLTLKTISIFSILFGILITLFGYRLFRFIVLVSGFIGGAVLFAGVSHSLNLSNNLLIPVIASLFGGIVGVFIIIYLYRIGIFLLGSIFGFFISYVCLTVVGIELNYFVYILPAIVFGSRTLFFSKSMIILITSFSGAALTVISGNYLLNKGFSTESLSNFSDIASYRTIIIFFSLIGLGTISQYFIFPQKKASNVSENSHNDLPDPEEN